MANIGGLTLGGTVNNYCRWTEEIALSRSFSLSYCSLVFSAKLNSSQYLGAAISFHLHINCLVAMVRRGLCHVTATTCACFSFLLTPHIFPSSFPVLYVLSCVVPCMYAHLNRFCFVY